MKIVIGMFVVVLSGLLLVVHPLRAASTPDDAVARGRAYVEKSCIGCHAGVKLDAVVEKRFDPAQRSAFDAFLATHHVPDSALRSDVIDYLEMRRAAASSR